MEYKVANRAFRTRHVQLALAVSILTMASFSANASSPLRAGSFGWLGVDSGGAHTCAVRSDHALGCWEINGHVQLGDGTDVERTSPERIGGSRGRESLELGGLHTCAHRSNSSVWCLGRNNAGQVGDGTTIDQLR